MKSLQITGYGDVKSNLTFNEVDKPTIDDNQVLLQVKAASVKPIDYKIIEGEMKKIRELTFPAPIGFDVSGVIVEKGANVSNLEIDTELKTVMASLSNL